MSSFDLNSPLRYYLREDEKFIGPFESMTKAFRFRRDFGPEGWEICERPDIHFSGLFTATTPEDYLNA